MTIRARVKNGLLEPLEKLDLPEGKVVTITILEVRSDKDDDAFRRAAGSWKGKIDADALIRNIYADRARPSRRLRPLALRGEILSLNRPVAVIDNLGMELDFKPFPKHCRRSVFRSP